MPNMNRLRSVSAALIIGLASASAACAQSDTEKFFTGKSIDFIIGARAGGGYAVYGAVLQRHIGKYLPGHPQVVGRYMDGAGSLIAANYLYTKAPKDGSTFGALFMGAIMDPLIGEVGQARFDPRKFSFIGSANKETSVCVAWHTSDIQTFEDLFKKELIVGTSGVTSSIRQYPTVLNNVLGTKFKLITGYPGSQDAALAMERGETQGICGIQWSSFITSYPSWLADNKVRILTQISSPDGDPELNRRGVPNMWASVKNDADRRVLSVIFSQLEFGRPYVLPPGVPADRVAAYRAAFDATMKDPEFLAEAKKILLDIDAVSGERVQKLVEEIYATPAADIEKAKEVLK
ncbi:MAG: Tripartite-type tricarboxylate transporter, receptor component TctC [Hyphomicrobiales bacterium]|jgi:tripartite-type tricarboxylate transporter receptor subunit TctC|nr:Tripartite-type tricarboxylate transporter, receptor component TctC [Hyphomicrobiales bacterium]